MNTPNALHPGASSTAPAIAESDRIPPEAAEPHASEQAYENSPPGAVGNVPGAHKAVETARTAQAMMSTSKSESELLGDDAGGKAA